MAPFTDRIVDQVGTTLHATAVRMGFWDKTKNAPSPALLAVALFIAVLPFDITQLIFVAVGAVFYGLVHRTKPLVNKGKHQSGVNHYKHSSPPGVNRFPAGSKHAKNGRELHPRRELPKEVERMEGKTFTWKPIEAPTLTSSGFEAEVIELLSQILPSQESQDAVLELGRIVKAGISGAYPHARVSSYCTGDLRRGRAFCVAVPDVDIVIHLEAGMATHDLGKFHKATLRACTEQLVSKCGFKFRRSAFRGDEPRVTLVAPSHFGGFDHGVSLDLNINAQVPYHNALLLNASGDIDPRAKELILLVKRWAKDRGICHAMKGDLSPYLWAVLVIYFLQVGDPDGGPILPPLSSFDLPRELTRAEPPKEPWTAPGGSTKGVGDLFKDFVSFYCRQFGWNEEVVSIRSGVRIAMDHRSNDLGLHIESPFGAKQDLASYMIMPKLVRLRDEFHRAEQLCSNGVSLLELLELWVPPEAAA